MANSEFGGVMEFIDLTNNIRQYKNIDLNVKDVLDEIDKSENWYFYTNGYNPDGTECESAVKGEMLRVDPDSNFSELYSKILKVFIDCISDYLSSKNDNISLGNLDINTVDSDGNDKKAYMLLRRYFPGSRMSSHEDAILPMNGGGYTALLYLNDNYEGGEIMFTEENISVKPSAGSLIIFPERTVHEVLLVKEGNRYMTTGYIFRKYPEDIPHMQ